MEIYIKYENKDGGFSVEKTPIECPYCHCTQIPEMYSAILYKNGFEQFVFCECTNPDCHTAFNTLYNARTRKFSNIIQSTQKIKGFNTTIKELSPMFCDIYNEAYAAEQMGLKQITGVGYRKALEFVIKDYIISLDTTKEEAVKKKLLGKCIDDDVTDSKIKQVAKRAAWLGNDETHYVRKWEEMDITHLKKLIDLSLHWIEAEIETKKMLDEMPEGK